jgi:hypothetical protein
MTQQYRTTSQENDRVASEGTASQSPGSTFVDLPSMSRDSAGNGGVNGGSLLQDPQNLRQRWESIQVGFVDNPRQAVGEAEKLVSSAISEIANGFRQQREGLEASWSEGREPSTDDLRLAFQSYRDFFGRLLQV